MPSHWTETALLSVKNEVHLALARVVATVLDQSVVFDTTKHSMLIAYLSSWFCVGVKVLGWCTVIYFHLTHKNVAKAWNRLKICLDNVKNFFLQTSLIPIKGNFDSKTVLGKLNKFFPVNLLWLSHLACLGGQESWCFVRLDFSFSCHVGNTCKASFVHMRDLKWLRGYPIHDVALLALVRSHLDYCNYLFWSLSTLHRP